ncbi:hypothetical protein CROQUDRAFT_101550 [Cronartium quercuum f. sp. fusiforme G11]|uniref:Uncharacterized protein n=1 Tax=Cronartium quercuum f. sp. fusiforme G11 TaxID=708437 RepID=A0A9P6N7Y2_9BASI|nr:hypothetical protein CROQUDRAFT_101550 [Cronartium quercuum f. sp. fusiforme G11]
MSHAEQFLKNQWELEQEAQASKKQAEEKQQLELGQLLFLQEELHQVWAQFPATAEQEIVHVRRLKEMEAKIKTQQDKVG